MPDSMLRRRPRFGPRGRRLAARSVAGWVVALLVAGCGPSAEEPEADAPAAGAANAPITVVATVGMVADVARTVAGDRAIVTGLMGSGTDPHLYRPTRTDVQRLMGADVVLYCGLLLEGRMTDTLVRAATGGRRVVAVTEAIDPASLLEPPEFEGLADPHVWMDPSAWAETVDVVRDTLAAADPPGTETYAANAAALRTRLAELDAWAAEVLATVPADRRVLVTAHDAFNYFGRRYGFEVIGIQGLSTESEAGVQDIERIVALLVDRGVPAVFVETTVSDRNVRALIAGAAARGHRVSIGGSLFSDAMGPDGTWTGTYPGMIDHNVTTIVRALGGEAPATGFDGRLRP